MRVGLFIVCLFAAVSALPAMAGTQAAPPPQQSLLERFHALFSKSTQGGDPGKTLQAPFINPADQKDPTADAMGIPYTPYGSVNTNVDLAAPHRDQDQVGEWLNNKVSEILNTAAGPAWNAHLNSLSGMMTAQAVQAYVKFMTQDTPLFNEMTAQHLQVHAFVENQPLLLNKGVIGGRFRWLYQVQATLSLLPAATRDYSDVTMGASMNYRAIIRIQIARIQQAGIAQQDSEDTDDPNAGLIIESWIASKNTNSLFQ